MLQGLAYGQAFVGVELQGFLQEVLNFGRDEVEYFTEGLLVNFAERLNIVFGPLVSYEADIFGRAQYIEYYRAILEAIFTAGRRLSEGSR